MGTRSQFHTLIFLLSRREERWESWWRIDTRIDSCQFFRRPRQLPTAITFDPELRLTHGLRLCEALATLFSSTTHANHGTVSLGIKRGRKGYRLGLWQQRTIESSKCLWGSCFQVGQELTSRLTVAAGEPSASVPATNLGF
ncbi:hypothetical protein PIB30_016103 [Stylosanthes scabra]|uniref:Uncharacterized protein n=1 Tax=Stylosanthes scabra TaxID=79078 RepID=A0ABU6Q7X2_9FABA|nr:hypothetical protein [Stylosanthes scabra]